MTLGVDVHTNGIDAHTVSVDDGKGGYTPLDEKLAQLGNTGGSPAASSVTPASLDGYDAGTGHGKLVKVKADGNGFDFVDRFSGSYNDLNDKPTIPAAYTLPAAGNGLGGVKKGAAVATVASADAAVAAGEAPTKAEFDAVVGELNETKRQLNALIASLKASGSIG